MDQRHNYKTNGIQTKVTSKSFIFICALLPFIDSYSYLFWFIVLLLKITFILYSFL